MKKLTLDPETLRVTTFDAGQMKPLARTVRAHEGTWDETCVTQCATGHCECVVTIEYGSC